jgi:hypothetical protein
VHKHKNDTTRKTEDSFKELHSLHVFSHVPGCRKIGNALRVIPGIGNGNLKLIFGFMS